MNYLSSFITNIYISIYDNLTQPAQLLYANPPMPDIILKTL